MSKKSNILFFFSGICFFVAAVASVRHQDYSLAFYQLACCICMIILGITQRSKNIKK